MHSSYSIFNTGISMLIMTILVLYNDIANTSSQVDSKISNYVNSMRFPNSMAVTEKTFEDYFAEKRICL